MHITDAAPQLTHNQGCREADAVGRDLNRVSVKKNVTSIALTANIESARRRLAPQSAFARAAIQQSQAAYPGA